MVGGPQLLALFRGAALHLEAAAVAIDAINVYPVPDGDTGSNMAGTLREAVTVAEAAGAGETLAAIARGALYGARGNSGVILSQALRGMAGALAGEETLDGAGLGRALAEASAMAYKAVAKPVEGTMLTVLRAAAEGAAAAGEAPPFEAALAAAVARAEAAEALTPSLLPALKEAGVTDSGGEGICVILRGLLATVRGEGAPARAVIEQPIARLADHAGERFGFCTEFIIEAAGPPIDVGEVTRLVSAGTNRSVVVVGDEAAMRVHVHTHDPEAVLASVGVLGRLQRTKVEDMSAQRVRFAEAGSGAGKKVAVLAMSPGEGFDALFASLGVSTMRLDAVEKPSARELAEAANALATADVILLPNHSNVLLAARQAVELARCTLTIVETRSLPQGIAAAIAFDASEPSGEAGQGMEEAGRAVRTVEVTHAAADRVAEGVRVRLGQPIALVDDRLVASAATVEEALLAGLAAAGASSAGLITLYGGRDLTVAELAGLGSSVSVRFTGVTVEAMAGGQALYPLIASVEM